MKRAKSITATEFKANCLALVDQVDKDGIVITKRGKAVAKLIPYSTEEVALIGSLKSKLTVRGDVFSTGPGEGPAV